MHGMDKADYDRLRQSYKDAVDTWVAAMREEEALATPDHSVVAMELLGRCQFQRAGRPEESHSR